MDKRLEQIISSQKGFTLVEVMIALTLFALFVTAFIMSQGSNITMSAQMSEDLIVSSLAERKMNEILIDPPEFTNATENDVETKNFEQEGFKKYKYTIEYKKLEIPDLSQLMGKANSDEEAPNPNDQNDSIKKMVFQKLKKNIEKVLWQVRVTITNTETDYKHDVTTWITNDKAPLDTNFGF
jgi:prepilin-type N-terminal cleavage/methylation domain-containing protein